jgi:chromosome partitioning protein
MVREGVRQSEVGYRRTLKQSLSSGFMRTLVVNNQKGGVGKTLLAVHAAWRLAETGARVVAIDLDPQANASYTLSEAAAFGPSYALFTDQGVPGEASPGSLTLLAADRSLDGVDTRLTEAVVAFRRNYAELARRFDYAVIDTPPTWSGRNYAALMVATTVVAPIDLETYALQGVRQLLAQKTAVEKNGRGGRPIDFMGLLPSRFQSTSPRQRANLEALLRHDGARLLFPNRGVITQRQGYAEALDLKQPVWTIRKSAAQEAGREIKTVLAAIQSRLDSLLG